MVLSQAVELVLTGDMDASRRPKPPTTADDLLVEGVGARARGCCRDLTPLAFLYVTEKLPLCASAWHQARIITFRSWKQTGSVDELVIGPSPEQLSYFLTPGFQLSQ